jgi:quercetin dioxygenase-like cupin family protein
MENKQLTTLDQPIKYPTKGAAEVSSSLLTLEPGQESGWHKDRVPLFVYVLEGTLSVEYDAGVTKEYPAGTSYMEAQGVWHNASNKTNDAVKLLRVYMGAKGVKSTVERSS